MSDTAPVIIDITPARGWTPALKARFLDRLAAHGNARAACRAVNFSPEAAYRLRRRDEDFARGWAAAVLLARENGVQVLAEHAIEGFAEEVWYRGKHVGTRRRFDTRLLLAHLARLDKLADEERAGADAARFDELVARIAGEEAPGMRDDEPLLPPCREAAADLAAEGAKEAVDEAWFGANGRPRKLRQPEWEAYQAECEAATAQARAAAAAEHDSWFARACAMVDAHAGWSGTRPAPGLPGNPLPPAAGRPEAAETPAHSFPRTLSDASTSALAVSLARGVHNRPGIDLAPRGRRSLRRSAIDLARAAA